MAFKKFPKSIQNKINLTYAQFFGINLNETEFPYYDYNSLGDFFIRRLKVGVRPIGNSPLIHPCDSRITEKGKITKAQLIQAKGILYSLENFTQIEDCREKYDQGYFLTYYLSPKDYHRVHSPVDGMITQIKYCTGDLWPVNDWSIQNIPQVYEQNERIYVELATEYGPVGVIFVGATNVGSISVPFDTIRGNSPLPPLCGTDTRSPTSRTYESPITVSKGERIGTFHLGSTVVLLFEKRGLDLKLSPPTQVIYGQSIFGM